MSIKKKPTRQIKRVPRRRVSAAEVSYKDPNALERYLTDEATILSRPETGLSQKMQRKLATAVKRARHLALLPFTQTL